MIESARTVSELENRFRATTGVQDFQKLSEIEGDSVICKDDEICYKLVLDEEYTDRIQGKYNPFEEITRLHNRLIQLGSHRVQVTDDYNLAVSHPVGQFSD